MTDEGFTRRLNRLLDERKLTVRKAAEVAGCPAATLQGWKSGAVPQDFLCLHRLAEHLGVTFSYLLTGLPDGRPRIEDVFSPDAEVTEGIFELRIRRLVPRHSLKEEL